MQFHQVPRSEDQELDDRLASITDRILSGEMTTQSDVNPIELENLRKTVLRVQAAVKPERPDTAMAARIKDRLQVEWKIAQKDPNRAWRWPQWVLPSGVVLLFLAGLWIWGFPATGDLPGAANTFSSWMPFLGVVCILLIAILVWIDRRR